MNDSHFFFDFEDDIDKNMFNIDFLKFYYHKLCYELGQLFDEGQSAIKCFYHQEYEFGGERGGGGTGHLGKPGVCL